MGVPRGLSIIEQTFYSEITQHIHQARRLTRVEPEPRGWAVVLTRTAAMLVIASFLILVLLPAALAASVR
jgi:hypothetical protein